MLLTKYGCLLLFCSVLAVFLFCSLSYTLLFRSGSSSSGARRADEAAPHGRTGTEGAAISG